MLHLKIIKYSEIDSTNEEAKRLILSKKHEGENIVVIADKQTAGKGRNGNVWESPNGNIYMSVVLYDAQMGQNKKFLPFTMAVAVRNAIADQIFMHNKECKLRLKWPNDIMINGSKVGGILIERLMPYDFYVVGIGINLVVAPKCVPHAVSLYQHDMYINYNKILDKLLFSIKNFHEAIGVNGFNSIRKLWMESAYSYGEEVIIRDGNDFISGKFVCIDMNGNIVLHTKGDVATISINNALGIPLYYM